MFHRCEIKEHLKEPNLMESMLSEVTKLSLGRGNIQLLTEVDAKFPENRKFYDSLVW